MSTATRISDVIVPAIFTPYAQNITEEKSRIIQSGVMVRDAELDGKLAGGGLTFNAPSWKDLDSSSDENISTDDPDVNSSPNKTSAIQEIAVRLSRNNSWTSMDLTATLAGADPMASIGNRVGEYWARRLQRAVLCTLMGVFADNDAAPSGSEHTQYDLTYDVSGGSFTDGVTNFTSEAFIDAASLMGDSMESLGICLVHSTVYARMQKNNLIDFVPDSDGKINIPTFLNRRVIVDDGVPNPAGSGATDLAAGIYHTLLVGAGALRMGVGTPHLATETYRLPMAGTGGGQDQLYNRVEWCIHPVGHKYAGTAPNGGPSNATSSNNLAHAASWQRVFPERKQIKIARLITRES
jgi:hypothetical protein